MYRDILDQLNSTFTFVTMDFVFQVSRATEQLPSLSSHFFKPNIYKDNIQNRNYLPFVALLTNEKQFSLKGLKFIAKISASDVSRVSSSVLCSKNTIKGSYGLCDLPLNE